MTLEMSWRTAVATVLTFAVVFIGRPATAQDAWRPARELLPAATQGMVEISNVPEIRDKWNRTHVGRLLADPAMEPFGEELRRTIDSQLEAEGMRLGVTLDDLFQVTSGELLVAWIEAAGQRRPYRMCLMADVRENRQAAANLLQQLGADLQAQGSQRSERTIAGVEAVIYTSPRRTGQLVIDEVAYALSDQGRLILCSRADTMAALLEAAAAPRRLAGGLVETEAYQQVDAELEPEGAPDLRWFARPLGLARIFRELADVPRGQRTDVIALLENQGFDAVQAAGGRLRLVTEPYDFVHRVFVYAPPVTETEERYRLAARLLQFPDAPLVPPPAWVSQDVGSFLSLNWKMEAAFWATETLVNEAAGDENIFRDILEGIREDVEGPQIDVAEDFIGNFGQRLMLVTDNTLPASAESERTLLAVELTDAMTVKGELRKAMESDPHAGRVDYPDHEIWEVRQEDALADSAELEDLGFGAEAGFGPSEDEPEPLLVSWAITVYDNYLLFSSHAELLVELIDRQQRGAAGPGLANDPQFQRLVQHIQELGGTEPMAYRVVFPAITWRVKYELLRRGELRESDSILATLIRRALQTEQEREQVQLQGQTLPPFEQIEQHLKPTGMFAETHEKGWIGTGFMLAE